MVVPFLQNVYENQLSERDLLLGPAAGRTILGPENQVMLAGPPDPPVPGRTLGTRSCWPVLLTLLYQVGH